MTRFLSGRRKCPQALVIFVGARFEQCLSDFPFLAHIGQRRRTLIVRLVRIGVVIEQLLNQIQAKLITQAYPAADDHEQRCVSSLVSRVGIGAVVQEDFESFSSIIVPPRPRQWSVNIALGISESRIRVRMAGQQQLHLITPAIFNGQIQRMFARDDGTPGAAAFLDVGLRVRPVVEQNFYQAGRFGDLAYRRVKLALGIGCIALPARVNNRPGNRKKQGRDADVRRGVDIRLVAQKQFHQVGVVVPGPPIGAG